MSELSRNELRRARVLEHAAEAPRLRHRDVPTELRQPVVPPPLVAAVGIRTISQFLDEPLLQHAADGGVERARALHHLALGARSDVLHDRIAVAVAVGQRDQDVKDRCWQRQETVYVVVSTRTSWHL